jgi:Spermine/spermidine synthase domain
LVTACTLAFQVVFTRMLSSVLAYHFSFLAISLALLGTGAGALLVYVRPELFDGRPLESSLARWTAAYGVLLIITPVVLVGLDYGIENGVTARFVINLSVACVLAAAPALAAGAVVALAIRGWPDHLGRVYAWDLVGAGLGALVIVPLLYIPAPRLLVCLGIVACSAGALFAWPDRRLRWRNAALAVGGIVVVGVSSASSLMFLPMPPNDRTDLAADEWHPLSRVQANAVPGNAVSLLFYDRVFAPVPNVTGDDLPDWQDLLLGPASIGYEITGPGDALIIGGGGGRDIYNALAEDQTVDVIELNSAIVDVVDDNLGGLSGSPYSRDGVSTTVGDGRAILAASDESYDQIHIGFTDTLSANAAQGFALTENNLYTLEAFDEYFEHLNPQGILNVSRLERLVGDEAIRATVLTMAALDRQGIDDPSEHMVVVRGTDRIGGFSAPYMTILARLEPFTEPELARIAELADERGDGLAFAPGGPYTGAWQGLAEAESWQAFCGDYPLDICPPTDDKPFFFNMRRLGNILDDQAEGYHYGVDPYQILLVTLGILVALSVVGLLAPLRLARSGERPKVPSLLYFAAIGLGFLLLETVLIQRFVLFLGFPTYALSVVLFALLVFTGVGSAITSGLPHTRRTLVTVLAATVAIVVVSAFTLQPALRSLIDLPFPGRVIASIALLAPVGIALGMPMPLGLARFSALYPKSVAYAWGVNGIASVLASVLGIVVAINFGYVVASLVAGGCYAFALAHARFGAWARSETPPDEPVLPEPPPTPDAELANSVPA